MAGPRRRWVLRLRNLAGGIAVLGGIWLFLGDRGTGPHRWWGTLVASLVAFGLIEFLVGVRAMRKQLTLRAARGAGVGMALLALGLLLGLPASWRWILVGAWPVAVVVALMVVWPNHEDVPTDG